MSYQDLMNPEEYWRECRWQSSQLLKALHNNLGYETPSISRYNLFTMDNLTIDVKKEFAPIEGAYDEYTLKFVMQLSTFDKSLVLAPYAYRSSSQHAVASNSFALSLQQGKPKLFYPSQICDKGLSIAVGGVGYVRMIEINFCKAFGLQSVNPKFREDLKE